MTDMYLKMGAGDLIYHYAYLTQAMVKHAIHLDQLKSWKLEPRPSKAPVEKKPRKPRGKLNAAKALKIYKSRLPHTELARRYNVHHVTISDIKHGRSWRNVTGHGQ